MFVSSKCFVFVLRLFNPEQKYIIKTNFKVAVDLVIKNENMSLLKFSQQGLLKLKMNHMD